MHPYDKINKNTNSPPTNGQQNHLLPDRGYPRIFSLGYLTLQVYFAWGSDSQAKAVASSSG